jgi:AraC-like DNA-binding protein
MAVLTDLLHSIRVLGVSPLRVDLRSDAAYHVHDSAHVLLHVVLAGEVQMLVGERKSGLKLRKGQYLFVAADCNHWIGCANAKSEELTFDNGLDRPRTVTVGQGTSRAAILSARVELDRARLDAVSRIMPEIKLNLTHDAPTIFDVPSILSVDGLMQTAHMVGSAALLQCAAEAMLINAVRERIMRGYAAGSANALARTATIATALRLMYRQPEAAWTIDQLAKACGMSRSAFAKAFTDQISMSPMAFLKRVRMMRAESLLQDARHTLGEIAHLTGYQSETAFNRAFSTHSGLSPGVWRKTMQPKANKRKPISPD